MRSNSRKVIAVHSETGERKEFNSLYEAARELGSLPGTIVTALELGGTVKGWLVFDTPERIRVRIARLEAQLKTLEEQY